MKASLTALLALAGNIIHHPTSRAAASAQGAVKRTLKRIHPWVAAARKSGIARAKALAKHDTYTRQQRPCGHKTRIAVPAVTCQAQPQCQP